MNGRISYRTGDASNPVGDGNKLIVHCCNNIGGWGSGFVVALSKRWSGPEARYRSLVEYVLGQTTLIKVEPGIFVANIIGQDGITKIRKEWVLPPVRYEALRRGFNLAGSWCAKNQASAHMPRIGCGLAGGDWALIEPLIDATFLAKGVDVTVYDFPGGDYFDSRRTRETHAGTTTQAE